MNTGSTEAPALATLQEVAEGRTEAWRGKPAGGCAAVAAESNVSDATGIDWGVDVSSGAAPQGLDISWDTIDWAVEAAEDGAAKIDPVVDVSSGAADINWDIVIEDSSGAAEGVQPEITPGADDDEATQLRTASVAAVRLAEDGAYRAQLTDDVLEIKAFLTMRMAAMQRGGAESLPLGTSTCVMHSIHGRITISVLHFPLQMHQSNLLP